MNSAGTPDDSWAHSDSPEKEPAAFELCAAPGSPLRYGHFEILMGLDGQPEELGAGTMATTYRARDTVLHSSVALKIINKKVAGDSIARSRFLREARAAAKLRHPNVGSVFQYGEQNGECYYVMELIRGETLAERVRSKGVFTPKEALEVGIQVARALAAAESTGLVHRDIKPSNLMLEADTDAAESNAHPDNREETQPIRIKVIDWGLAKSISAEDKNFGHDQTRDGFIGTPGFASPEQFEPAENRVDTRSDIYSLGVTLWYMLCGRTPLVGETLQVIHERQKELPWEQLKSAKVPARLIEVLRSILAFDAVDRPQSAREALDLLRSCQQGLDGVPARTGNVGGWQSLLAIGLIGLILVGAGWLWQHKSNHRAKGAGVKPSLAVLPFENLSPDQAQAFFTVGMQYGIRDSLASVTGLNVLSQDSTASYDAGQPRDYAAIGRKLGVKHLVEGSVRRVDQQITISVGLVDTDHPDRRWETKGESRLTEIFSLQGKLVRGLINHLQASLSPEEDRRLNQPLTNDPVALDLYLQSTAIVRTALRPKDNADVVVQRGALLKAAVQQDPNFFQAYCELVVNQLWLYEHRMGLSPEEQSIDYRGLAETALAQARRLQPDSGSVHMASAYLLFIASHDPDQAWVEAELAQKSLPNTVDIYQLMGYVAYARGRWREATESLERACALDPSNWDLQLGLAQYYRKLRRTNDFEREWQLARDTMPPGNRDLFGISHAAETIEQTGDLKPLRKALAALPAASDPTGRIAFVASFLLHFFERDAQATAQTLTKYAADPVRSGSHFYPRAWYEARLDWLRGDNAQAQRDLTVARNWMEKQVIANPNDGWPLSMLALFDAGLGRKEEATQEALRAVDLEPHGPAYLDQGSFVRGNLAVVYAWTGQISQAFDVLESATDKPGGFDIPSQPSYGDLLLNPCWDSLRGDPRFRRVLERFQKPVPGS